MKHVIVIVGDLVWKWYVGVIEVHADEKRIRNEKYEESLSENHQQSFLDGRSIRIVPKSSQDVLSTFGENNDIERNDGQEYDHSKKKSCPVEKLADEFKFVLKRLAKEVTSM